MTYQPTGPDQGLSVDQDHSDGDDLLERLIRLAEPGPEPPPHGARLVREALRGQWRTAVLRRRRQRAMYWAGGALAAAAVVALAFTTLLRTRALPSAAETPVGRIVAIHGSAQLIPPTGGPARTLGADAGDVLPAGSRLVTGSTGLAAIALTDGASLRLDNSSSVRLASPRTTFLDRGAVYVDSEGDHDGVKIVTEHGIVTEIGTQFEVRHGGRSLRVRVREGAVHLSSGDARLEVLAGAALEMRADGATTRSTVSPNGPEWDWVLAAAPPLAIEGRSADEFLRWAAREMGLVLDYSTPAIALLARSCILHGSVTGLTPAEAPAVVLPSCGLAHHVDGSRLIVGARTGQPAAAGHPAGAT